MSVVTFCGHREVWKQEPVSAWLHETVEELIAQGAKEFLLGGYGLFDQMAARVVWDLKKDYPDVTSVLVIPYPDKKVDDSLYDIVTYPPLEHVLPRYAISRRNEWMIRETDILVAYVLHDWGGAAATLTYAKRKKKTIIRYEPKSSGGCDIHDG